MVSDFLTSVQLSTLVRHFSCMEINITIFSLMFLWGAKCVCLLMMVSRWCLKVRAATMVLGNCVCVPSLDSLWLWTKFRESLHNFGSFSMLNAPTGVFTFKIMNLLRNYAKWAWKYWVPSEIEVLICKVNHHWLVWFAIMLKLN